MKGGRLGGPRSGGEDGALVRLDGMGGEAPCSRIPRRR